MDFTIRAYKKEEFNTAVYDFVAADNPVHDFGLIIYEPAEKENELRVIIPDQLADIMSAHQLAFLMSIY